MPGNTPARSWSSQERRTGSRRLPAPRQSREPFNTAPFDWSRTPAIFAISTFLRSSTPQLPTWRDTASRERLRERRRPAQICRAGTRARAAHAPALRSQASAAHGSGNGARSRNPALDRFPLGTHAGALRLSRAGWGSLPHRSGGAAARLRKHLLARPQRAWPAGGRTALRGDRFAVATGDSRRP